MIMRSAQFRSQANSERAFLRVSEDERAGGGVKNEFAIDGPRMFVAKESVRLRFFRNLPRIWIEQAEPGAHGSLIPTLGHIFHGLQDHVAVGLARMVVKETLECLLAPIVQSIHVAVPEIERTLVGFERIILHIGARHVVTYWKTPADHD